MHACIGLGASQAWQGARTGACVEIDDAATAWRRDVGEFVSALHLDTCSMLAAVLVRPMPKGVLLSQLAPICV